MYKDFIGTGFAANDLGKMDGQGGSAWYTYDEWWERFGASCVHIFYMNWYYALSRYDELLWVEVEVTAPAYDAAFPIGDTIIISISHEAGFTEEPTHYTWTEDLIWNTSEPPNMGGQWKPAAYQFWPVEYHCDRGFYYEYDETRIWWLFTFEILENFVKKYFNPLKPDSARVVYQILPMQYGDPDTVPNPLKMEVEIRDKDSVLVRNWELTTQEQKDQVVFWDGKDNGGQVVDFEEGSFSSSNKLQYRSNRELPVWVRCNVQKVDNKGFGETEVMCIISHNQRVGGSSPSGPIFLKKCRKTFCFNPSKYRNKSIYRLYYPFPLYRGIPSNTEKKVPIWHKYFLSGIKSKYPLYNS
jgi:hypothetical protein